MPPRLINCSALCFLTATIASYIDMKNDFIGNPLFLLALVRAVFDDILSLRHFVTHLDIVHPTSPLRAGGTWAQRIV
jgi:hypothetical protein